MTGRNRGIGKSISLALGNKGINIAINFYKDEDKAYGVIKKLEKFSVN